MELSVQGFHFLFQGVQLFFGFHGGFFFQILISFLNTQQNEKCYSFGKFFSLAFLYTKHFEKGLLLFEIFQISKTAAQG